MAKMVARTLLMKFTAPSMEPQQLLSMMQAAQPFYELFGGKRARLLQNADYPTRYIQTIDYEAPEEIEVNRQRFASDARLQGFLQAWRSVIGDGIEIDIYQDVANGDLCTKWAEPGPLHHSGNAGFQKCTLRGRHGGRYISSFNSKT